MAAAEPAQRLTFPRRLRLQHARQFDAIRKARVQRHGGPLAVSGMPNGLPHGRLGLSVGARVGGAVVRNRFKRLIREAFRLSQRELPRDAEGGYDLVVAVRPHGPLPLEEYRRLLVQLAGEVHGEWGRRVSKAANGKAANGK
ncbi:MAG: ribonuclease P protein component [Phycisphaerales bacterium]